MTKIFVATPSQDSLVHVAYHFSLVHTLYANICPFVLPTAVYDGDLVRVRSRYVADFLESDATHLLWADSDIEFAPAALIGMLAAGKDFVAAPYRKKKEKREYAVRRDTAHSPTVDPVTSTVRITGCGLGFALMTRKGLEIMVDHYRPALRFTDVDSHGAKRDTVALFQLVRGAPNQDGDVPLLSEDLSFCSRWTDLDGEIYLYVGEGSPVTHHGSYRYVGDLNDLGKTT